MLPFIRPEINQLQAYQPHPGGHTGEPVALSFDRLDTNECPYDLPDHFKHKLTEIYQQIESNRYPDGSQTQLKQAIATYVNESAGNSLVNPFTEANISVGNGSDELIRSILIATCIGGAGSILVANPTFSMYAIIAQTLGVPVVSINRSEDHFEMDLEKAQQAIDNPEQPIRAVFVVHPNSPTANRLTAAEISWLQQLSSEILVVVDEAYFEFSQQTLVTQLEECSNWVILRTFSKAFRLASHRVGYAIAQPELITALEKVRLPYNLPSYSQAAAHFVMIYRDTLLSAIPEILAERQRLSEALQSFPQLKVWPSNANFLFLRFPGTDLEQNQHRTQQLCQRLKQQGTLIRHTCGGLRITVGTPAENQRTLERLTHTLNTL